ncbi:hypothetical protein [Sinomonas sp. ASV322]|uniref:LysM peptidoglycan-binding domain-containing protein n=1 Tax=Sinomonas sp. ASV322 TaxID=3041920 RepID=UPI0027DD9B87|nr:hypothetical protein [Sinomonas sp. ASV322]MDQ4503261.1 hypothetical protein [Sinomonas sp. ASV322]
MNSRSQQAVVDAITATTLLGVGAVLVAAGRLLVDAASPGTWGDPASLFAGAADGNAHLDVALGLMACAAGLAVVSWWLVAMTFAVAAALFTAAGHHRQAGWASAVSPAFMRRLALTVLGMTLMTGTAAHAAPDSPDPAWSPTAVSASTVGSEQAGPLEPMQETASSVGPAQTAASQAPQPDAAQAGPTSPTSTPSPLAPDAPSSDAPSSPTTHPTEPAWTPTASPPSGGPLLRTETRPVATINTAAVEVRPGDSLWTIVARQLGPGASELDVADAWPRWFDANREVIGGNPDVIRPGQLLCPPNR